MRRRCLFLVVCQLACASTAVAQAWVPPQGEGTVSIVFQNYYVTGHFNPQGQKNKNGATHTRALIAELDYGITDTIGLTVSLPFIASKYTGPPVYSVGGIATFPGPLDDGSYHGALQDVRIETRRVFSAGPLGVTPFVGVSFPTHAYETHGEAVPGRHRRELQLGASAGVDLAPLVPRTYMHVRYAYLAAERQHGFPSVRSTIDLEGGLTLTSRLGLRGLATWQIRHKGPTIQELAADDWFGHDRFIVSSFFNAGGGLSLSVTSTAEIYALWVATVSGRNGAHVGRMLAVGTSWNFGSGFGGFGARPTIKHERFRSSRRPGGFGT